MAIATDVKQHDVLAVEQRAEPAGVIVGVGRDLRGVNTELRAAASNGPVRISTVAHLSGLAAGLRHGEVDVEGDAADYLAVLNDGAVVRLSGNAGCYLADNMTRGTVIVEGNAGHAAAPYCYGGTVVIRGDAGDFTAVMNKGATIIVCGDVGDDAATYMLAGDLIVVGDAGCNLGNYLIRGNIYVGGRWRTLGRNTRVEDLTPDDEAKLSNLFGEYGVLAEPRNFQKVGRLSEKPFYGSKATVPPDGQPKQAQ